MPRHPVIIKATCRFCGSKKIRTVNGLKAGELGGTHIGRAAQYFTAPFDVVKCEDCQSEEVKPRKTP